MRRMFQMNSIQSGELPIQQSYHTESPWKLYRLNLGESAKPLRWAKTTQTNFIHQQQQLRSFVQSFNPFC